MPKWFKDNIINILQWLLPSAGTIVVIVLALIQHVPWYLIFVSVIAVICLILFGINQIETWKERHKKRLSQYADKEIEDIIREWVDIPNFSFQRQQFESTLYFKFMITDNFGRIVNIIRNRNNPNMIHIMSGAILTLNKGQSMNQSGWEELAGRLSIEMARLGIQFSFDGVPNRFEGIRLTDSIIIDDSLAGFYFRQRIMFVIRAVVLIANVRNQFLKEKGITEPTSN